MDPLTPPSPGLLLTLIGNDPRLAAAAAGAGVGRVLVDLEKRDKAQRQRSQGLFLSEHNWADVTALRSVLPQGALFVRLDPLHHGTAEQIERALGLGADGLMLPYFTAAEAIFRFIDFVAGRCVIVPLIETSGAVRELPAMLASGSVQEFHVGLNDLALDLGLGSLNELWGAPILEEIAAAAHGAGIPFGVGGVTDPRMQRLPINPAWVIAEQRRLGSTRALLGRSFRRRFEQALDDAALAEAVEAIQAAYRAASARH